MSLISKIQTLGLKVPPLQALRIVNLSANVGVLLGALLEFLSVVSRCLWMASLLV